MNERINLTCWFGFFKSVLVLLYWFQFQQWNRLLVINVIFHEELHQRQNLWHTDTHTVVVVVVVVVAAAAAAAVVVTAAAAAAGVIVVAVVVVVVVVVASIPGMTLHEELYQR